VKILLLLVLFVTAACTAFAQAAQQWPLNKITNKIEFKGRLPWPDTVRTEAQRQALVRRWYRRTLTNDTPAAIRDFIRESGVTFGGVPKKSCYRLNVMNKDKERFALWFSLNFMADTTGLTYHLFDFEYGYGSFDFGFGDSLENALLPRDGQTHSTVIESFHSSLLTATKSW